MKPNNFLQNTKSLLKLAYPILIAQLIQNLMGFADTVMAGRVSATDMAAVAVASSVWLPLILTIYGLIMALATIVSNLSGAKKFDEVAKATHQTAWIAIVLGISLIGLFYLAKPYVYQTFGLDPQLKELMFDYLSFVVWGAPGFCLYIVLRNYSEGLSFTKPTMIISIIGLLINIPANYIFIYGEFGMPALGGAGCGLATGLVYWVMFISMLIYVLLAKPLKKAPLFSKIYWPEWQGIKEILTVGVPIALSLLFEVSLFSVIALIIAPFGVDIVASHQITINFTGMIFMVPLSIAMAVTIKVGFALGEKDHQQAKDICNNSYILGLGIAVTTALFTLAFREYIPSIYTNDENVIALAANLMLLGAMFQLSDYIQVISAGALRGYKDTKSILYITFISYWVIGLGLGSILGLTDWIVPSIGAYGFWVGIILGLTSAAILLGWRLKVVQKRLASSSESLNESSQAEQN
ncbi:MATE family efflux transporter [Thalassotalea sp. PLHSN55]|uniref:MATE family efflux transporter n=1 Tax=Thalassotalea sp. PLHSN55 TaxID=3435888 RepID=UPI003F82DE4E